MKNPFKISDKVVCVEIPLDYDAPILYLGKVYTIENVGEGWVEIVGLTLDEDGTIHAFLPKYFRKLDEVKRENEKKKYEAYATLSRSDRTLQRMQSSNR